MINLYDAKIVDCLPSVVANQTWAQAISYAMSEVFRRFLDCVEASGTFAQVDKLDHDVLDILAVDLRVSNYDQAYPLELKRKLVKLALQYWATAGTKAATEEVVQAIFGDATITEWFEYDGTPGCFKIEINDTRISDKEAIKFQRVAENVKRLSAWLEKIVLELKTDPHKIRVGLIECSHTLETVVQQHDGNRFHGFSIQTGTIEEYIMEGA